MKPAALSIIALIVLVIAFLAIWCIFVPPAVLGVYVLGVVVPALAIIAWALTGSLSGL